jgi:pantoate--beta-alanine ligase
MILFKQARTLSDHLNRERNRGKKIGFVPTMGALHHGHMSLLTASKAANEITVCSIFVNPTQFNNPEDFKHYPITLESDLEKLVTFGCDILFLPSEEEIYPHGYQKKHYALGSLEERLEGFYRPGHFQGVCQVMDRLLEIVHPDDLYMGQKDFQQCIVVKKLLELTGRTDKVHLHIRPTVRERDGLAMSSRNMRLSETQKQLATSIYRELLAIKTGLNSQTVEQLKSQATSELQKKGFAVDYVEIAKADDLQTGIGEKEGLVALVAASLNGVRLIDNMLLN